MDTRLSDLEQLVFEIKKFRPDCTVAINYLNKVIDKLKCEDVCQMCLKIYDMVYMLNHKK